MRGSKRGICILDKRGWFLVLVGACLLFIGSVNVATANAASISAKNISVVYDGSSHSIASPTYSGFSKKPTFYYSTTTKLTSSNYTKGSKTNPSRINSGRTTVHIYAKYGSKSATTTAYINIKPKVTANDYSFRYDGVEHSIPAITALGNATVYYGTSALSFSNYKSSGTTSIPRFSAVNTSGTTVYYCAVPNTDPNADAITTGSIRVKVLKGQVPIPSGATVPYSGGSQTGIPANSLYVLSGSYKATNPGTYTATVRLSDSSRYEWADGTSGSKTVRWTITKAPMSSVTVGHIQECTYNGEPHKPTPTLKLGSKTLVQGKDYTVTYSNNVNAGTAYIIYNGMGTYFTDSTKVPFSISKAMPTMSFSVSSKQAYRGGKTPKNELVYKGDGNVTYTSSNTAVASVDQATGALHLTDTIGTTTIQATASAGANYLGRSVSYALTVVEPTSLAKASAKLKTPVTYTGKTTKPSFVVKVGSKTLKLGKDYTVLYSSKPRAIGSYVATIKGIEAYKESCEVNFKVTLAKTHIKTCKYSHSFIRNGKHYKAYKLQIKGVKGASGYEIAAYRTPGAHKKWVKVDKKGIVKIGLISGKKNYISIKAYKEIKGKEHPLYGPVNTTTKKA